MKKLSKAEISGRLMERQIIITPYSVNGEVYEWHVGQYGERKVCKDFTEVIEAVQFYQYSAEAAANRQTVKL
jgi:hypothetical protein